MHFHISYLFLSLENAHRQLNDHKSHSNWIESQIKEQITLIMFSGAFCARFFSQPSQISSCGVSGMHQIGYWSKWKSHNRHFLISHLSLLRYIYLQFSFWTSHLRFMPKSCLRRPRGSEPTTRNFRGSLCWELRWIENLFAFVFKEDKSISPPGGPEEHRPCVQEPVWEAPWQAGEAGDSVLLFDVIVIVKVLLLLLLSLSRCGRRQVAITETHCWVFSPTGGLAEKTLTWWRRNFAKIWRRGTHCVPVTVTSVTHCVPHSQLKTRTWCLQLLFFYILYSDLKTFDLPNWIAVLNNCCNSSLIFSGKCLSWRCLNAFVEPRLC